MRDGGRELKQELKKLSLFLSLFRSLTQPLSSPSVPSPPGNVVGPSSYFVCTMHSCRLFIYVNLPFDQSQVTTSYPLAAPVSEGTHL